MGLRMLMGLAGALTLACTQPRTEVIVITDTDLDVPSELDEMRIEVTGPDAEVQAATALFRDEARPPRHLGLVHDGGRLGPFLVRARGFRASGQVVERSASFEFQEGRTLVLRMDLLRECVGTSCPAAQTCAAGGCRSEMIAADELEPFDGQLPDGGAPVDSGAPPRDDGGLPGEDSGSPDDAGGCVPATEACNGQDDDCDSSVDEGFDLATDTANCGACGATCAGTCAAGVCDAGGCAAGTADCDADPSDCETNTDTDRNHCGGCDVRCRGADGRCCAGVCQASC